MTFNKIVKSIICQFVTIILLFLGAGELFSQKSETQDTLQYKLEPIEVKATHSSVSTERATRSLIQTERSLEEINSASSLTLDKLTYTLPGVWVNNRHNYAFGQRMMIRGIGWRAAFGIRGIQVILDGIPLTSVDGQTVTNLLDPSFIRRLEVLRGPASTYWGNSSGGVIYMSTRPSYDEAPTIRARGMAGSYGMRKTEAEFIQQWNRNQVHVFGSYFQQNGFRKHSESQIGRIGLTSRLNLDDKSGLRIFGAYASMPKAQNPSTLNKEQARANPRSARSYFVTNNAREEVNHGQAGVSYYRQLPVGTLTFTGYGIYRDLVSPLPFAYIELDRLMGGSRLILENEQNRLSWNLGIESKYQHDDRINRNTVNGQPGEELTLDQLETVLNHSIFGLLQYEFRKNVNISAGLRYDWMRFKAKDYLLTDGNQSGSRNFYALSPSLGFSHRISNQKVYFNASSAFEAPTTTELVNRPGDRGGFNPNIEPEKTLSLEAGITNRSNPASFSYEITFYTLWINDFLLPYQTEGSSRVYYRNEGRTHHSGLEATAQVKIGPTIKTQFTYNYIRARFLEGRTSEGIDVDENTIPGIPDHRISISTDWSPGDFRIHFDAQWINSYPVNSLNTFYNNRYLVLNSRFSHAGLPLSQSVSIQPFFEIDNIANTRYNSSVSVNASGDRYYEPAPGRHWSGGIALEFH